MNYSETIEYLYSQLPMFTRIGAAAYKSDLHNTIALLDALNNPHTKFKSVHIAGTNGKGSTSHMLAAIFQANGYKTGLYTSPHLKDFRERIKINGQWIDESFVIEFTERMRSLIENIEPSFFEVTVAMAFEYFAQQQVDIAIIETGLGGRLDSTNVIIPELSIITNIGWDHMNLLGDSLDKIAYEKAGIIKHEVPVIIGETLEETRPEFKAKAALENAPILFAEKELSMIDYSMEIDSLTVEFKKDNHNRGYSTDLSGIYQQYNLRTVLVAIDTLKNKGWQLKEEKNRYALLHIKELTGLHGRWEVISKDPCVILDVAHNEDGIKQVLNQLLVMNDKWSIVKIVIGMVKDKEVEKVLALFPAHYQYYFTNAHLPRAMLANELQQKASVYGLKGNVYDNVNDALKAAIADNAKDDLIVVCGSVFVVGEVNLTF